ncbi:hypothetical protein FHS18_004045 [Paenibacillus phyllosphaerae]|uniref:Uncharacterized protein n=1 Tax=Paenibacillus phyllosphaerae TaxID=274593 RepID=A0A7W5B0E7_9BACL|nr:hypothetical protein [Paenibacillus phyllosphaerae]
MKLYNSPQVVQLGNSSELIKGACDWGTEGIFLDKAGAQWWNSSECDSYYKADLYHYYCNETGHCVSVAGAPYRECETYSDCPV